MLHPWESIASKSWVKQLFTNIVTFYFANNTVQYWNILKLGTFSLFEIISLSNTVPGNRFCGQYRKARVLGQTYI